MAGILNKYFPLILLAGYFSLGLYLLRFFQYQINADGEALISVARALKAANFYHSVNAYWGIISPLILVPFLFLDKVSPLLAFKLANLIMGALGIWGFYRLSGKYISAPAPRKIISLLLIPLFLYFAFFILSGDLLVVTLMLYYLNLVFDKTFGQKLRQVVWAGILGGLLVLSKEYFLYFITCHLGLIILLKGWRRCFKPLLPAFLIILTISFAWAGILTLKYHTFMFGSKGTVNFKIFGPETPELPMFTQGLIPPPNPFGLSSWDDPTLLQMRPWNPLASQADVKYLGGLLQKNSGRLLQAYYSFSWLLIPILGLSLSYLFINRKRVSREEQLFLCTLLTFLAYPLGYMIIYMEDRYLWPNYILGILLAVYLTGKMRHFGFLALVIIILTFLKTPVSYLKNYHYVDHTFFDQSKILQREVGLNEKNIASNGNWHQTLYLCVYLNCRYYGQVRKDADYQYNLSELQQNKIDYYFSWNDNPKLDEMKGNWQEVKIREISNLRLFKVKQ